MSSSRVAGLTHEYEEFLTSPSGGWTYSSYMYPDRMDYHYANMGSSQGFASIDVSGTSFTVNFYKTGTTSPVWSKSFTKVGAVPPADNPTATHTSTKTFQPTATAESTLKGPPEPSHFSLYLPMIRRSISMPGSTPIPTKTATQTSINRTTATRTRRATRTPTSAVSKTPTKVISKTPTSAVSKTPTLQTGSRPLKYYAVDRVLNNADYAKLANHPPATRETILQKEGDADMGVFARQALTARSWPQPNPPQVRRIFSEAIGDVLRGKVNSAEALRRAQGQINEMIDASRNRL